MKWKASSHAEAASVLNSIAKSGIRVLAELDVHVQVHNASNDNTYKDVSKCKELSAGISVTWNFHYEEMVSI